MSRNGQNAQEVKKSLFKGEIERKKEKKKLNPARRQLKNRRLIAQCLKDKC
jgi:hypothetical protein